MNPASTIRPSLCKFTFVFIGLAIAVFTWGLQYKLSLYYPPHSTYHQIPEAKLLSRNEQSIGADSILITRAAAPGDCAHGGLIILTLFGWVLALLPVATSQARRETKRSWLVSLSASLNAFFFRPPPLCF